MRKAIIASTIAAFASTCGPRVDNEERPPGELVYEDSFERLYRLDRRIEVIYDFEREDGLEGFDHSPFSCDCHCCPAELRMVPWVYFHAANNLQGAVFEIEGEPYVAIEPDQPCQ
jgi:hypothetical protein